MELGLVLEIFKFSYMFEKYSQASGGFVPQTRSFGSSGGRMMIIEI